MTETFASRLIHESNQPAAMAGGSGRRGAKSLKAGLVSWVALLLVAAQGCALVGEKAERDAGFGTRSALFWDEPPHPEAYPGLAAARYRPELVNLVQSAALAQVAGMAPTRADFDQELACLALNIYHEARGEPRDGQVAVAQVVLNRVESERFPDTVCRVVRQGGEQVRYRCQFSWWCDGRPDRPGDLALWESSKELAEEVYWGRSEDPTQGALWYHANYVSPYWGRVFQRGVQIGKHIFYHETGKILVASSE
ncbi:MAG: cell wall hydrolase [Rhodospirillales bacterium]|nr:cell wall hydrolase [Rhodospirillales bacterium]